VFLAGGVTGGVISGGDEPQVATRSPRPAVTVTERVTGRAAPGPTVTQRVTERVTEQVTVAAEAPAPAPAAPPAPAPLPTEQEQDEGEDAYYANCDAARAAGAAPLSRGEPGYRAGLDRDGDGSACE